MQELGEIVSTAVMPLASPLRKAAYRALMLKKLQAQISKLEPGAARQMFERLMKTHPRVMAAFEHSGGVIRRDPSPPGSSSLEEIAENRTVGRLGRFRQGPSPKDLVPGLRDTRRYPTIGITPESFVKPLDQSLSDPVAGFIHTYPPIDLGATAAHETTHWAQALGGISLKKADAMLSEINKLIRMYDGLDRSVSGYRQTNAGLELLEKIRKLRGERSALIRRVERGAERAGGRQSRQMRVEQSGFPYRISDAHRD
jgi:hypothetical protein